MLDFLNNFNGQLVNYYGKKYIKITGISFRRNHVLIVNKFVVCIIWILLGIILKTTTATSGLYNLTNYKFESEENNGSTVYLPVYNDLYIQEGVGKINNNYLEVGKLASRNKSRALLSFDLKQHLFNRSDFLNILNHTDFTIDASLSLKCVSGIYEENLESNFSRILRVNIVTKNWNELINLQTNSLIKWSTMYLNSSTNTTLSTSIKEPINQSMYKCNKNTINLPMKEIINYWLKYGNWEYGILLWIENDDEEDVGIVQFGSQEHEDPSKHPLLKVKYYLDLCIVPHTNQCPVGFCAHVREFYRIKVKCERAGGQYCDFEEPCAWNASVLNHNGTGFVLTRGNETEKPGYDYSMNSSEGFFVLLDSKKMKKNENASLVSPWFENSGPNCKLYFAYYSLGSNVGPINILRIVHNITTILTTIGKTQFKPGKGAQIKWTMEKAPIGEITSPFQIAIEVVMESKNAIVAIDSITLDKCFIEMPAINGCSITKFECPDKIKCLDWDQVCDLNPDCMYGVDETLNCDKLPENSTCTFESGICGWTNISADSSAHWVIHQGSKIKMGSDELIFDHTYKNISGHFLLYPSSFTNQENSRKPVDIILKSPLLGPPPPYHFQKNTRYYKSCKIRFFYFHRNVRLGLPLKLHLTHRIYPNVSLWSSEENKFLNWRRASVPMPANVTYPFYLEFVVRKVGSTRAQYGIDDISFTPECFRHDPMANVTYNFIKEPYSEIILGLYEFTSCGAKGPLGPSQQQCQLVYKHKLIDVTVNEGIQEWKVPKTDSYIISVMGAGGGTGVANPQLSRGAFVHATFNLTKDETIYILVGQEGESGCFSQYTFVREICSQPIQYSKANSTYSRGGGGGGGGGSFVYKKNKKGKIILLVVAGGGGGMSYSSASDISPSHGQDLDLSSEGKNGYSGKDSAGAGGGIKGTTLYPTSGHSLSEGGAGGSTCENAKRLDWKTDGGFGGGGAGCIAGGGGGGYTGGNASLENESSQNGYGGTSFASGLKPYIELSVNEGSGLVEIIPFYNNCFCTFMCLWDSNLQKFECVCPNNQVLGDDGKSCIESIVTSSPEITSFYILSTTYLAIIIVCVVILILACVLLLSYFAYRKKQAYLWTMRQETFNNPQFQLNRLRQGAGMVTEYNPNYEFGGCTSALQDLKEIPRENLTLVQALGQGAFGEVYQGFVSNMPDEDSDLPVAIKTLPELSTDQAEMDFLMEALIMSKFIHPNIVRFIGVCFEKLPRFIVLELLPGGDLKSFLRENRPKPERPSPLTMLELIKLATDIAKGCQYLEGNHFIHRDIAARNCLLTTKGSDRVAKIADFGMARDIYRADYYRKGGKAMLPVKWMPPEAFLDGFFTCKTDVWSFGVLLWEVFSLGYMPYPGKGNQEVMQLVTSGGRMEPPSNCPAPICQIMTQCWQTIPDNRPSFSTVIERLGYCTQDPDVLNAPLPVFHRPPSTERDATVMRPPDSDDVCLQVYRSHATETSSFNSSDYLIPMPISPIKTELQSASSAESIDKLLDGPEATTPLNTSPKQVKWTKNLIDNDINNRCPTENISRIKTPAGYMSVPSDDAPPIPKGADTILFSGLPNEQLGSNNESPIKNANRVNKSPPASIARSRPSVKNPVRDVPSLLSLDKLQMNKPLAYSDEQCTGSSSDLTNSPSHKPTHDQRSSLSLDNPDETAPYVNVNVDNIPSASSSPLLEGTKIDRRNHRRSSSGPGNQAILI